MTIFTGLRGGVRWGEGELRRRVEYRGEPKLEFSLPILNRKRRLLQLSR